MERFGGGRQPLVVVDYAHTPDALEQALQALRAHCHGKLWCIFGCGGERDTGKRPLMGAAAEQYADRVVVTDDNPRGEDPIQIVADIMNGMGNPDAAYLRRDRTQAIAFAIEQSGPGDVILVAGKGHEDYQQIGARRIPYSDRRTVALLLRQEG
jgi:UDP-N-acetylmuramoyl-L-alanyl-D-glutamate--2,6-diaminopimelate ligase